MPEAVVEPAQNASAALNEATQGTPEILTSPATPMEAPRMAELVLVTVEAVGALAGDAELTDAVAWTRATVAVVGTAPADVVASATLRKMILSFVLGFEANVEFTCL